VFFSLFRLPTPRSHSFLLLTTPALVRIFDKTDGSRIQKCLRTKVRILYGISARKTAVSRASIRAHRHYLLRYVKYSINHFHGLREREKKHLGGHHHIVVYNNIIYT